MLAHVGLHIHFWSTTVTELQQLYFIRLVAHLFAIFVAQLLLVGARVHFLLLILRVAHCAGLLRNCLLLGLLLGWAELAHELVVLIAVHCHLLLICTWLLENIVNVLAFHVVTLWQENW